MSGIEGKPEDHPSRAEQESLKPEAILGGIGDAAERASLEEFEENNKDMPEGRLKAFKRMLSRYRSGF